MKPFFKGFIPALVLPIFFGWVILHFIYRGAESPWYVIQQFIQLEKISAFFALSCIPNLALFFLYLNREKWNTTRGIIAATMLYALVVFITYFSYKA